VPKPCVWTKTADEIPARLPPKYQRLTTLVDSEEESWSSSPDDYCGYPMRLVRPRRAGCDDAEEVADLRRQLAQSIRDEISREFCASEPATSKFRRGCAAYKPTPGLSTRAAACSDQPPQRFHDTTSVTGRRLAGLKLVPIV
jgi:hypothetical protein